MTALSLGTLGDAFKRSGFKTDRDRLNDMLHAAVEKHGGNASAGVADFAKRLLAENSAPLIWEFFALDRNVRLYSEVERMIRQIRLERGLDNPTPKPTPKLREGQVFHAEQSATGNAPSGAATGGGQVADASNGQRSAAAPVSRPLPELVTIARDSLLYGPRAIRVNGIAVGNCPEDVARDWAGAREKEGRFVRLLAEGVPAGELIGKWKTEEDAHEALRLATEATNG